MFRSLFISISIIPLASLSILASTVTVQKGENLSKIARENNITLRELMDSNQIFDANKLKEGQVLKLPPKAKNLNLLKNPFHIVKEGDSLNKISSEYRIEKKELIKINNLKNPNKLYKGQKIFLPKSSSWTLENSSMKEKEVIFHIISKGETLTSISNKYKVPVQRLMEINKFSSPNSIPLGTKIYLNTDSQKDFKAVNLSEAKNSLREDKDVINENKDNIVENKHYKKQDQFYEWRGYGPLKINWSSWKLYEGNHVASSIHKSGKPLFIAVRCKERRINRTGPSGEWRKWIAPRDNFEHDLINDRCASISNNLSKT
tara:strand:- start:14 stop:964 length:951 start_codon:yes stop_codon:yes gene_type:complete